MLLMDDDCWVFFKSVNNSDDTQSYWRLSFLCQQALLYITSSLVSLMKLWNSKRKSDFYSPTNNSDEILSETIVVGTLVMYVLICLPSTMFQHSVIFVLHLDFEITSGGIYTFYFSIVSLNENLERITNGICCSWQLIRKLMMLLINLVIALWFGFETCSLQSFKSEILELHYLCVCVSGHLWYFIF